VAVSGRRRPSLFRWTVVAPNRYIVPVERLCPELIAEMACTAASPDEFDRGVLALFDQEIGVDVAAILTPQGPANVAVGFEPNVRAAMASNRIAITREFGRMLPAARNAGGVVVDSEYFGAEFEHLVTYDVIMRPHRGRTTLLGVLSYRQVSAVALGRCAGSRKFRAREIASLREVLPVLRVAEHRHLLARSSACGATQNDGATQDAIASLTPREREVLSYLHLGYTNQQIALALGSSPRTVRNQLSNIYRKLEVSGRTEAVAVERALANRFLRDLP
jgi:DNA-binding CsgD family transcriptional regulator